MNKIDLSIVVPCYNEGQNVSLVINKFRKFMTPKLNIELVLVDNGSTDSSFSKLKIGGSFLRIVKIEENIGYGNGIWHGLKKARGEYICWTHADMQTDIGDTLKALKIIKKIKNPTETFVKGKRYGRPLFDSFLTLGMSILETVYLGKLLYDINAQPNLFHKSFLKNVKNPPKDFSFDLYMYYLAKHFKYNVIRFPVYFGKRIHGASSWNNGLLSRIKFIKRTLRFTFKLKGVLRE